jgi:Family of unknown function (DUF5723)
MLLIGCICSFIGNFQLYSQEQLGLRLDNYSGVNAIALNPAANATSAFAWDVNLIGLGLSINNNLAYIEKSTLGKALRNANRIGPDPALNIGFNGKPLLEYNFNDKAPRYGSAVARVMGPSFVVNLSNGHSFGVFTGVRTLISTHSIPIVVNPYETQRLRRNQTFDVAPFKIRGLAWSELGFNYAYRLGEDTEGGLAIGINAKWMQGFQGFFVNNNSGTKMTRLSRDTVRFDALNGELGFTNDYDDPSTRSNGNGFGFDVGVLLTTPASDDRPYTWRFGASLVDMGKININRNAEVHQFQPTEAFEVNEKDFENLDTNDPLADAIRRFNQKAFNNGQTSLKANSMTFGMPMALQLQADYALNKNIFINGLLIQRVAISQSILERDNLLAVTPRYETRWLGASIPISVLNYQQVRVGLAARLAFLTIGTEHLMSLISNTDLYGTDFYVALKINPFQIGQLSSGGGKGKGGNWGKSKRVSCYKF